MTKWLRMRLTNSMTNFHLPANEPVNTPAGSASAANPQMVQWFPTTGWRCDTRQPRQTGGVPVILPMWRGGRVVEGAGLENRYTPLGYRGFESRPLRHPFYYGSFE